MGRIGKKEPTQRFIHIGLIAVDYEIFAFGERTATVRAMEHGNELNTITSAVVSKNDKSVWETECEPLRQYLNASVISIIEDLIDRGEIQTNS